MSKLFINILTLLIVYAIVGAGLLVAYPWVVQDVFAGAVAQGILPATLTFEQALKVIVLIWVVTPAKR